MPQPSERSRQSDSRGAKTALFDEFARLAQALANGRRLEIVDVLANGERTVERLAAETGLSVANARRSTVDRKSTRLNSSHDQISYAVFCLKKKKAMNVVLAILAHNVGFTPPPSQA